MGQDQDEEEPLSLPLQADQLSHDIAALRGAGDCIVVVKERAEEGTATGWPGPYQTEADHLLEQLGYRPLQDRWATIDGTTARLIGHYILHRSLAYGSAVMSEAQAQNLAQRFFALVPGAMWYGTNAWPVEVPRGKRLNPVQIGLGGWAWQPVTDQTFDRGVVVINATHIGLLWVMEED